MTAAVTSAVLALPPRSGVWKRLSAVTRSIAFIKICFLRLSSWPANAATHARKSGKQSRFSHNPKIVRTLNRYKDPPNKDLGEGLNTTIEFYKLRDEGHIERVPGKAGPKSAWRLTAKGKRYLANTPKNSS
jgi:hypothetical protein